LIAPEARVDMEEGTAMGGKENAKVARRVLKWMDDW
jgi:hypothetical protein